MAHDDPDDTIWTQVLALAAACGGEANDFHAVDEMASAPDRPLYVLIHPGDIVQSDSDVAYSKNPAAIQEYSRQCQGGIADDTDRLFKHGWNLAVLHRFSSSYAFGVSNCLPEFTDAVDTIHDLGLVMFGDNLRAAADYLIAEMDALARPAILLSGAWSNADDGCVAALGQMLEEAGARVHLAASACVSTDGHGKEWKAKRPKLDDAACKALAPPPRIAFQDEMEGDDRIFIYLLSRVVSVQTELAPDRYFRFGPGNPIIRLKAITPSALNRIYIFETADGTEIPYPVEDILARMMRQEIEILRPIVWPIAKLHLVLLGILAHGATCLAATIEGHLALRRPSRADLAADLDRAALVLALLGRVKSTRGGVVELERAITEQITHELQTVTRLTGRKAGAGKIRRHQEIANSLQNARSNLSVPGRTDVDRARERLAAAVADAATNLPAPKPRGRR